MKRSTKVALTTGALGVAGALFLVGSSYADRGGFGPQFGMMGGGGFGGHGGPIAREMLKSVDTDEDGALSQDEIDAAITVRFETFDADGDGSLSLEEFEALWADITRPLAVRAFQFLDPDGDAAVSKAEVDDQFGDLVAHMDRNEDGVLDQADRPHRRGGHRGHGGHGPRGGHHDHGPRGWGDGDGPRGPMDGDGPRGPGGGEGPRGPGGGQGPQSQ